MFTGWLAKQLNLQRQFHPDGLPAEGTPEWREYVEYNVVAIIKEMGELLAEVQTSPWKHVGVRNYPNAREEFVDVLHHIGNIGLAIGLDDMNLTSAYEAKLNKNYDRILSGRSKVIRGRDSHPVYGRSPHAAVDPSEA